VPGIKGWKIYANDTFSNENVTDVMTFELWGYSNITWISPADGSTYSIGDIIELVVLVRDNKSAVGIANYPVEFWWYNETTTIYLGQNLTNSSGYAVWYWDTSGLAEGWYYPKANITDNASLYYNISADWEANSSVELVAFIAVIDVSVSNIPIELGSLNPGTTDYAATPVVVTIYASTNVAWNLSVRGSGDFSGPALLALGNLEFGNTSTNVIYDMTTSYQGPELFADWVNQPAPSVDTNRTIYFEINIPAGQVAGDYSTQVYINVTEYV
jgi:hypothetical protein